MQIEFRKASLAILCLTAAAAAQTATERTIQLLGVISYPAGASTSSAAIPLAQDNLVRVGPERDLKAALAKTVAAAPTVALTAPDPTPTSTTG